MPVTLERPCLEGFADVEQFAIEHDLTESLFIAHDILRDLYPPQTRIFVEHYTDPEDGHESLFFSVCGPGQATDEEVKLHLAWNHKICRALEPDALFRIGMLREYTE